MRARCSAGGILTPMRPRRGIVLLTFIAAVCASAATAPAADRPKGDVKLFAAVPMPGAPEPVVIAPDGTVYTATLNAQSGATSAPSKASAFSPDGKQNRSYDI